MAEIACPTSQLEEEPAAAIGSTTRNTAVEPPIPTDRRPTSTGGRHAEPRFRIAKPLPAGIEAKRETGVKRETEARRDRAPARPLVSLAQTIEVPEVRAAAELETAPRLGV